MEKLFLLENDLKKISILKLLVTEQCEITLHALKEKIGYSYSKLQNLTAELDLELTECFDLPLLNERGRLFTPLTAMDLPAYRTFLIKKSTPYRFLLSTLVLDDYQLMDFAKEHFISQASISRRLQPLKAYLDQYEIKLNSSRMKLTGQELQLRILLFNLFWLVDQGSELCQQTAVSEALEEQSLPEWMRNIPFEELQLWLAIFKARQQKQHLITEALPDSFCMPTLPEDIQLLCTASLSEADAIHELAALSYLLVYWPVYFDHQDPRTPYLVKTYQGSTLDYLASLFFAHCDDTFLLNDLAPRERKLLYINLLNAFGVGQVAKNDPMPSILDFMNEEIQNSALFYFQAEKAVSKILRKLAREPEFRFLVNDSDKLAAAVTFHLLPYFNSSEMDKLSVGIKADANQFLVGEIASYCRALPFVSTDIITGYPQKSYDVTITVQSLSSFEIVEERTNKTFVINDLGAQSMEFSNMLRKRYTKWLNQREVSQAVC